MMDCAERGAVLAFTAEEGFRVEGIAGFRTKPRFSYVEVKLLLEAVKRNRYILLKRFNQGVSAEAKKQTWTEITEQINSLGENQREVRQIMKKWADLKCDGKRRIIAMRGPNGRNVRKKNLGPVEKMVHKILMMSPRGDGESDVDLDDNTVSNFSNSSYPSVDLPHNCSEASISTPEKKLGEHGLDYDDEDDEEEHYSLQEAEDSLLRTRPTYTYSRNNSHGSSAPLAGALLTPGPPNTQSCSSSVADSALLPTTVSASSSAPPTDSEPSVALSQQLFQSVQQQRTSRLLLGSASRSLEALTQSVQLLVESQQEFVQESLKLQRQTVDTLMDFSNTALTMLRDKSSTAKW